MNDKNLKGGGHFYGVGLGPGDPELLTLKAVRIIKDADCIFVPKAGSKEESMALEIVKDITTGKRIIENVFPMTKDSSLLKEAWSKVTEEIKRELELGNNVAFLTIGDPLTYSTYVYLLKYIKEALPDDRMHTVPGITSYNAAASLANFPLLERDKKLAVVPVSDDVESLRQILESFDTVVLMKVAKKLDEVIELLDDMGLANTSLFASNVGWDNAVITQDITSLKGSGKGYMSVIIVKKP
jgi:precorrin-2/cobalt-factor-2 C20-methyltransferase